MPLGNVPRIFISNRVHDSFLSAPCTLLINFHGLLFTPLRLWYKIKEKSFRLVVIYSSIVLVMSCCMSVQECSVDFYCKTAMFLSFPCSFHAWQFQTCFYCILLFSACLCIIPLVCCAPDHFTL